MALQLRDYNDNELKSLGFDSNNTTSAQNVGGQSYMLNNNGRGGRSLSMAGGGPNSGTPWPSQGGANPLPSLAGDSDVNGTLQNQRTGMNNLLQSQQQQQQDYLGRYQGAIKNQEALPDMANRIGSQFQLPQLNQAAQGLNDTLSNIVPTQQNATRGFGVNQNQLDRIIANQQQKIAPLAQRATAAAQNAQNLTNQSIGYTQQQQQKELAPYQTEAQMMGDYMARQFTGYTQQNQNELTSLLQKQQQGFQMSENDKNRMNQLAIAEQEHQFQADQLSKQFANQKALIPLQTQATYGNEANLANIRGNIDLNNQKTMADINLNNNIALQNYQKTINADILKAVLGQQNGGQAYGPPTPKSLSGTNGWSVDLNKLGGNIQSYLKGLNINGGKSFSRS